MIYVTGYGPFPGVPSNPTADLAIALHGTQFGQHTVCSEVLPVSYEIALGRIRAAIRRLEPTLVVNMGVDVRADRVRVESTGVNRALAGRLDVDGSDWGGRGLLAERAEDEALVTSLDVARIVRAAERAGYASCVSDNAGRYLCNAALYASLLELRQIGRDGRACFLHLPDVGAVTEDGMRWSADRLREAVGVILPAALEQLAMFSAQQSGLE